MSDVDLIRQAAEKLRESEFLSAVADWLDSAARYEEHGLCVCDSYWHALKVARAFNERVVLKPRDRTQIEQLIRPLNSEVGEVDQ